MVAECRGHIDPARHRLRLFASGYGGRSVVSKRTTNRGLMRAGKYIGSAWVGARRANAPEGMEEATVLEQKNARRCPLEADRLWQSDIGLSKPELNLMESFHTVLGCRLRWLRVERGLSCSAVAAQLDVPPKLVAAQERGKRRIAPHELAAYVRLYGIRISTLFSELSPNGNAAGR